MISHLFTEVLHHPRIQAVDYKTTFDIDQYYEGSKDLRMIFL